MNLFFFGVVARLVWQRKICNFNKLLSQQQKKLASGYILFTPPDSDFFRVFRNNSLTGT